METMHSCCTVKSVVQHAWKTTEKSSNGEGAVPVQSLEKGLCAGIGRRARSRKQRLACVTLGERGYSNAITRRLHSEGAADYREPMVRACVVSRNVHSSNKARVNVNAPM